MIPTSCGQAELMLNQWPFSFIETCGVKCTALRIGFSKVVTAANCVTFDERYGRFLVTTAGTV